MKEYPILFNGEMVRAYFAGLKTQTRRVVKPQPNESWSIPPVEVIDGRWVSHGCVSDLKCPYGQPGDRLWGREAWRLGASGKTVFYRAGGEPKSIDFYPDYTRYTSGRWHPSIHMPRVACRITPEIVSVRVERVQDITGADLFREGIKKGAGGFGAFETLWNSINAKRGYGWDVNPWVWVVEFERYEKVKE